MVNDHDCRTGWDWETARCCHPVDELASGHELVSDWIHESSHGNHDGKETAHGPIDQKRRVSI